MSCNIALCQWTRTDNLQAFLMQYLGNMSQSWILNSYAARLIVALDYHASENPLGNSDLDEEIRSAVYWCFYLDRTLSSLLYRPLSLPELRISPTSLINHDQSLPHIPLIRILLDLAQIQGELLGCGKTGDTRQIIANHSRLQDRMEVIHSQLEAVSRVFLHLSLSGLTRCPRLELQRLISSLPIGLLVTSVTILF
jgi:hypothetical protein